MMSLNYIRSEYDHCVYFKNLKDIFIILVLCVIDMLSVSKRMDEIKTNLGYRNTHRQENGKLRFSQQKCLEKILVKFGMNNVKPIQISLQLSHFNLSSSLWPHIEEEKDYMSCVPNANAIESLMYVMICIRLDISHVVGVVNGDRVEI